MMTKSQAYRRLGLIVVIYLLFAGAHSLLVPLQHAPDEMAHFLYSRFIAQTGHLPRSYEERAQAGYQAYWPGLYHAIIAAAAGWSHGDGPPYLKFTWETPRPDLFEELTEIDPLANTEDERWPYRGSVLMWHLGRAVTILLGLGLILLTFYTALELWPGRYRPAVWAAALVAFIPTFVYISSVISYDPMLGFVAALYLWLFVRIFKGHASLRNFILLGLLMGLSVTVKYTTVILPLHVVGMFGYLAWRQGWGWWGWLKGVSLTGLASMVAASWWFIFLIIHFNEIEQYGLVVGALKPIIAGGIDPSQNYIASVLTGGQIGAAESEAMIPQPLYLWVWEIFRTFWVPRIKSFPYGPLVYGLVGLASLLAAVGWRRAWSRRPARREWLVFLGIYTGLFIVFPLVRFLVQGNIAWTGQGRHVLFPVTTALPLLLIMGWSAWLSLRMQRLLALLLVGGLACATLAQTVRLSSYYPPLLPLQTDPQAVAAVPNRLDAPFGDHLTLLGYDQQIDPANSALKISLYWQSVAYPPEDYRLNLTLLRDDQTALVWESYPLDARYPTRLWDSRELIRDDVWLPVFDLLPGRYQVQIQLTGDRGPLPVGGSDSFQLAPVQIPALPSIEPEVPLPVQVEGRTVVEGLTLWQAETYFEQPYPRYYPRTVFSFVWQGQPQPGETVNWLLVDSSGQTYPTQPVTDHFQMAMVGLNWPSDDYRLRAEVWRDGAVLASHEIGPLIAIRNKYPRLMQPPSVPLALEANFANRIKLLGYDLPQRTLAPGEGVPVTLFWQGLQEMEASYTVFTKLLDEQQQVWGSAERLPADGRDTRRWWKNEFVVDGFELPVKPHIPDGIYWLNLGLYEERDGRAVSLPLVLSGQTSDVTSLTFGPVKVGPAPLEAVLPPSQLNPQFERQVELGQPPVIRFRGHDRRKINHSLHLTLYWESLAPTPINWNYFVHIRDANGVTIAQNDGPAGVGNVTYPASLWAPGEIIADEIAVPLPEDFAPGRYDLVIGLYKLADGVRLPVPDSLHNEIILSRWEFSGS